MVTVETEGDIGDAADLLRVSPDATGREWIFSTSFAQRLGRAADAAGCRRADD
jgi:hypothetical protein